MKRLTLIIFLALSAPAIAQVPGIDQALALYQQNNFIEAKKIADDFATKGEPKAYLLLGNMAQKGLGEEVDLQQAQIWFQKGADVGDADNEFALAMLLLAALAKSHWWPTLRLGCKKPQRLAM